jgi:cytosine/adenosine deaminase-related metal-dependent hydrolase
MSYATWSPAERLIAAQAVALQREVMVAMEGAAFGQGLAVTEAAVMQGGREFLRKLLQQALSAHPEAQKRGSAPGPVPAVKKRRSRSTRRRR